MGEQRRRYLARDGVAKTMIFDPDEPDRFAIETLQDVEPIIDGIARDREIMAHNGPNKVLARVPRFIAEDLDHRGILHDEDAMKKWLNSPEAAVWRIWRGAV